MPLKRVKDASRFQEFNILDLAKNNWSDWSENCLDALLLVQLKGYVENKVSKPADTEVAQRGIWEDNDGMARACIRM